MDQLSVPHARRLALYAAGLLKPEWQNLPRRAAGSGKRARDAALAIIRHFGYLQLDTVSIAGVRSHGLVLHSRLDGFDPMMAETLLQPDEPLFEYWGHEVCWLPMQLYPHFAFRRQDFASHPWWGDLINKHPRIAANLRQQIRDEGPLRSLDMEGQGGAGWWNLKLSKKVATALWSAGELAVCERSNFQRSFDLVERVIPAEWREHTLDSDSAISDLLEQALAGHGWATASTLAQTWRLKGYSREIKRLLQQMAEAGRVLSCVLITDEGKSIAGWIRPADMAMVDRLKRLRPRDDSGVLLSPFDPVLWDRSRVQQLFDFHQLLEIFKPASQRVYGYYCLPVLAGETLVARVDLKAHKAAGELAVLSRRYEDTGGPKTKIAAWREATDRALQRYAEVLGLRIREGA
ncbi:MAG: winged helix-turn-helix domain-containing protein [Wenzhouxiangellaceae bacterium]